MKKKPTKKSPKMIQKCAPDVPQLALTLLDWFAGQALQGYLANQHVVNACCDNARAKGESVPHCMAEACYGHAKAMMEARKHGRS